MVMRDDSCSRGCGFESLCHIMDGEFFTLISCKNCVVCSKIPKINKKEAAMALLKKPFVKIKLANCNWLRQAQQAANFGQILKNIFAKLTFICLVANILD